MVLPFSGWRRVSFGSRYDSVLNFLNYCVGWRNRRHRIGSRHSRECFQTVEGNPRANPTSTLHFAVSVFRCQLLHVVGLLTYPVTWVRFREQPDVLIYLGCEWRFPGQSPLSTFSSDRDVDGLPLLPASLTESVVIAFEWQFVIVPGSIVAFLPFTVCYHLYTRTTEFHTS
jgi:hypothetical protein